MKILFLDIESAPNTAYVWGLWKENIPLNRLVETGYILCWSAKWLGEKEVMFGSVYRDGPKMMLKNIHSLLEEADAVIHYNGLRYDIPVLNREFLLYGLTPPSPYKQMDLLKVARNQFKFTSNKLDHVAQELNVGKKFEHIGFELWVRCMGNDPEAWKMMEEYNKQDVLLLEKVYEKFRPWIKSHANYNLYTTTVCVCPNCGSTSHHKRGVYHTSGCTYQRYRCTECGSWFRGTKNIGKQAGDKYVYAT
jgi:hypothetical protein